MKKFWNVLWIIMYALSLPLQVQGLLREDNIWLKFVVLLLTSTITAVALIQSMKNIRDE
ncbi:MULTISPECIES: hypothetical protein [Vagococcus]|uniref:hypothetical protein n=1 Tax=Vagococcus TaxID=2737 RepID=UPI001314DF32|nr:MULTISPECIES: hypothetical protein [Vagococcus]